MVKSMTRELISFGIAATVAAIGFGAAFRADARIGDTVNQDAQAAIQALRSPEAQKTLRGSNSFGLKLLGLLAAEDKSSNVFISPTSISLALTMTANGAAGTTRSAMLSTLALQELNLGQVNAADRDLSTVLHSADPNIVVDIANSIWIRDGLSVKPTFIETNRKYFGAQVSFLDFKKPQSVATINQWVSDHTQGKIEKIIQKLDPLEVMHLINAVYFKGKWSTPFKKESTKDRKFFTQNSSSKVPMMEQMGHYRYAKVEGASLVSIPYGNGSFNMTIVLPDAKAGLEGLIAGLTEARWLQLGHAMRRKEGTIIVPRWKSEYSKSLEAPLKQLGMGIAFTDNADFSGIRKQRDLCIGSVNHKTFIQVDEEGTEAAAVTDVGMITTAMPAEPEKPFRFVADHPFLYAIQDANSGAILFIGVVRKP